MRAPLLKLAALSALIATPALAAPADFLGTWTNTNPGTRGITRIVVTSGAGGALTVQAYGKCSPTDCDWGKAPLLTYGMDVTDKNHRVASAVYNKGFSNTILHMDLNAYGLLNVYSLTQFVDNSGRQNYASQDLFRR